MVDSVDTYKSNHLKTKPICNYEVKKLPYLLR